MSDLEMANQGASNLKRRGGRQGKSVRRRSKLVLALGVEELVGAGKIRLRHEDLGGAVQVAVVRRGGVHEILRGGDAVFFKHHHEHVGVDERAGVKQFHVGSLATDGHR